MLSRFLTSALFAVAALHADVIAGRVLEDHTGAPLPRAEVRFFKPGAPAILAEVETDSRGQFRSPDLPAGDYLLRVSKPNYTDADARLNSHDAPLSLRLMRYGAISGHVLDSAGQPVQSAQVVAVPQPANNSATTQTVSYNGAGAFRIYGLPPGRYALAIVSTGEGRDFRRGALWHPREFAVAGGEDYTGADFLISAAPGYTVSGKIDSARTMSITLVEGAHPGLRIAMGISRPDGSFRFDGILDGAYDLLASAQGSQPSFARSRIVVASRPVEDVAVSVTQGHTVTLRPTGECADAVAILTSLEAWLPDLKLATPLHPPDPVTLQHVAPSRFVLSVTSPSGQCSGAAPGVLDFTGESAPDSIEVPFTNHD